jgi:monoamine oxidase
MGDVPVGGYDGFVSALAQGLDIRTGVEVIGVESGERGVLVHCAEAPTMSATHVVVTVPLGVLKARTITFEPPLADERLASIDRLGFGVFDKLALKFDRPFWTEAGIPHVVAVPSAGKPPVHALLGLDSACGDPVLAVFAFGSTHGWIEDADLGRSTKRAHELLRSIFGGDVPTPVAAVRSEWWRDPYARGSYTYLATTARPHDLERLGEPHAQRVLFAGEATGYARVGFVDGALDTGAREAKRLTGLASVEIGRLSAHPSDA